MQHDVAQTTLAPALNGATSAVAHDHHTNVMAPGRDGPVNLLKEPCFALNYALARINRARVLQSNAEAALTALQSNGNDPLKRLELQSVITTQGEEFTEATGAFLELKARLINLKPRMAQTVRWKLRDSRDCYSSSYDREGMPSEVRAALKELFKEFR